MNYFKISLFLFVSFAVCLTNSLAETIKISVPEMECENCSHAVEDRLKQDKDITKISTDLKERVVTVYTVDSVKVSDEKLKALIKDSGFEATSIERVK
jgi:copper chaperone CopZ